MRSCWSRRPDWLSKKKQNKIKYNGVCWQNELMVIQDRAVFSVGVQWQGRGRNKPLMTQRFCVLIWVVFT